MKWFVLLQIAVSLCYNQRANLQGALLVFRDNNIRSHDNKKNKRKIHECVLKWM